MRTAKITFSVLSHDEVVHLKCSMINKMPGLGFDKYANLKAGYAFIEWTRRKEIVVHGTGFCTASQSGQRNVNWTGYLLEEPGASGIQSGWRVYSHV